MYQGIKAFIVVSGKQAIKLKKEAFWPWLAGGVGREDFQLASKLWQTIRWLWKGRLKLMTLRHDLGQAEENRWMDGLAN